MFKKKEESSISTFSSIFFLISLVIIIAFLAYFSIINNKSVKECTIPNKIIDNFSNYSYNISVKSENVKVDLYVKRYNKKYLIEKTENGEKTLYFIHYSNVYEKASNGKYIKHRKESIIDGIDNNLLILDYINDISLNSSVKTEEELTCYNNRKLDMTICINLDGSINLKKSNYTINYDVKDIGEIKDFNVDIDSSYIKDNNE